MIEVSNLTKRYGPNRSVEDLSFAVGEGDIMGFLGPNGAGKSTTIRMLAGLSRPTAGNATIAGFDVQSGNAELRRLMGYLPEQGPLYLDMTLDSYLRFMAGIKGVSWRRTKMEMERVTEMLNLKKERRRLLRNLSKGTRQRAAIANALLGQPKVLLLDEPTSGLDPAQINDVREVVRSLEGKCTVILSTHILTEIEHTATRIVILSEGKIAAQGSARELKQAHGSVLTITARGDHEAFDNVLQRFLPGQHDIESVDDGAMRVRHVYKDGIDDTRSHLAAAIIANGLELLELRADAPSLEEIFLRAIGKGREAA
ncbi:MAG: ABC transporter ATP-binding protein [Candidatus Sumerlaeia bacterium]|nr:ABC transporter ATP-binding protein [Candidatus Sumerlaeia bacterium]